jgi:lipoate synthase
MLTLVETINPETAKTQVERLNSDFSRFEQVIQVLTVAGEVVLNCPVPTSVTGNGTVTEAA